MELIEDFGVFKKGRNLIRENDFLYSKNILDACQSQDCEVFSAIEQELNRQSNQIELIASENFVSCAVLAAVGSILTNKYAEGYPGARYYGGCEYVDTVERLAIERVTKLFECEKANVQPHSGVQANIAVMLALINPGDTILGMGLEFGGHLTHGHRMTMSGKWFVPVSYSTSRDTGLIDYEDVLRIAHDCKPKLIIAGSSSYPRSIDFQKFREIADSVGAYLLADVAHYSGLIAVGEYPSPIGHAHVTTSTTHKTLRGPRGGIILWNEDKFEEHNLTKRINSAVFPGTQGGPLMHVIAGKAVAFGEALRPEFKEYIMNVKSNAKILGETLCCEGANLVTGGTDSHMVVVDLRPLGVNGKEAEKSLENSGLTCNKNSIPYDGQKAMITSGIRLGSPAATTRGFNSDDFVKIGQLIAGVLKSLASNKISEHKNIEQETRRIVISMCQALKDKCL